MSVMCLMHYSVYPAFVEKNIFIDQNQQALFKFCYFENMALIAKGIKEMFEFTFRKQILQNIFLL